MTRVHLHGPDVTRREGYAYVRVLLSFKEHLLALTTREMASARAADTDATVIPHCLRSQMDLNALRRVRALRQILSARHSGRKSCASADQRVLGESIDDGPFVLVPITTMKLLPDHPLESI